MTTLLEQPSKTVGLVINAPEVFKREDFMAWLNKGDNRVFTWHPKGDAEASEYSDVVVLVDSNYEGDSSDMPEDIWRQICDAAYAEFGGVNIPNTNGHHVHVRLTNLAE